MGKVFLSKSKYRAGRQCPKILWLKRNKPELEDLAVKDDNRLAVGSEVGELAVSYFGKFVRVPFEPENPNNYINMVAVTKELIDRGETVIAEASFIFDGNFCSADVLRKVNGGWELIEVKSSSDDTSGKPVENIDLDDMAYQYHVITNCGLKIVRVQLMRLNTSYVRQGDLVLEQLFKLSDFTAAVLDKQGEMDKHIANIKAIAAQNDEPDFAICTRRVGEEYGCNNPYECSFKSYCWRHVPLHSVYDIAGMWGTKKDTAYNNGIITFSDILKTGGLKGKQLRQVETEVLDLPPFVDVPQLQAFLSKLKYPLYYLDFETMQQAIPLYDGINPYGQVPFQYSLHFQLAPFASPFHKEFLAKEGTDPRRALAERLCADIPKNACILAYHASVEKGIIKKLAEEFLDLREHLLIIQENIEDLEIPFSKGMYYCKQMKGRSSIKAVLPALYPNDKDLDYHALDELVQDGSQAMAAFSVLHKQSPEVIDRTRKALLAYCKLDTLAMVKVLDKLHQVAGFSSSKKATSITG